MADEGVYRPVVYFTNLITLNASL